MADFAAPIHDGRFSARRQHHERSLQGQLGWPAWRQEARDTAMTKIPLFAAAVLDGMGKTLFGQPAVITPADRGAAGQRTRLFQQPRHHPHRITEQRAVAWGLMQISASVTVLSMRTIVAGSGAWVCRALHTTDLVDRFTNWPQ